MLEIEKYQLAIEAKHRCKARYLESGAATDFYQGEVSWTRIVHTFEIAGHPDAQRCHAWSYLDDDGPQLVTMLEVAPVDSAESAVEAATSAAGALCQAGCDS